MDGFAFKNSGLVSTERVRHRGGISSNLIFMFDDQLSASVARKSSLKGPENVFLTTMILILRKSAPGNFQLLNAVHNGRIGEILSMIIEGDE